MMKRVGHEPHPAVIERRYSDFCFVYECILRSFHPSILGDFMFPKKVSATISRGRIFRVANKSPNPKFCYPNIWFHFDFQVLIGNFKAEVISERTDAFHKFLNLIANCDNLLYSDYFYSFLSSEEHNEAVSHLKLARYINNKVLYELLYNSYFQYHSDSIISVSRFVF